MRDEGLLRWQWSLYPGNHQDRRNLAVHLATVPLFWAGTVGLLASPVLGPIAAGVGAAAMAVAVGAQGRTHKHEQTAPVPFDGPLDVVQRLFVEQWVTFPRFVLSGAFARAWKATR